jgi:hypothetical protein
MSRVGLIPVFEREKSFNALDRAATVIGINTRTLSSDLPGCKVNLYLCLIN